MPATQSRIDGFLSPSASRTRKKQARPSDASVVEAPGIQLNFVDPGSYTVSTVRQGKARKGQETMGRGKEKGKGKGEGKGKERRPRYGDEPEGPFNPRPVAPSTGAVPRAKRHPREWDVISENSSDAASVGSAEGTPERLGAVRLEAGKSQLRWGDRGRFASGRSGSGGSSGASDDDDDDDDEEGEEEEERRKRRVVVSGDESDAHTPTRKEPDVIDLDSGPDVPRDGHPIRSSPQDDPLADMFSDIPDPIQPSSSGYTRAARRPLPAPASSSTSNNNRRRRKREPTPEESSVYSSEDPERIIASPPPYRRAPPSIIASKGKRKASASVAGKKQRKRGRRGVVDPDDEDETASGDDEEEEDPEALVKELEMDTPGS